MVTTIKPRREGEKRVSGMKKVLILGSVILAMCGVTSCGSAKQFFGLHDIPFLSALVQNLAVEHQVTYDPFKPSFPLLFSF